MDLKKIILGYPLDLLLDRNCKYSVYEEILCDNSLKPDKEKLKRKGGEPNKNLGGLTLPFENNPGSGNIIIRGKPGTAKSTLALQIACIAAQSGNDIASFYITLEESPQNIINKCKHFGWGRIEELDLIENCNFEQKNHKAEYFEQSSILSCQKIIQLFNKGYLQDQIEPKVLLSTFTPRNIFSNNENPDTLFETRYKQLENMLISASNYNREAKSGPQIGLFFIDSLNVFGDSLLTRTQLFRLFELFKIYKILGVFIVEEDEKSIYAQENKLHSETIEYIADLVISLTIGEDEGYSLRYFEITKSKYQHQVYGKHPFKIIEPTFEKDNAQVAVKIYPSLHYIVYGTDNREQGNYSSKDVTNKDVMDRKAFCDPNANFFLSKEHKKSSSLLIEGPRDTFKTSLARDFLLRGLFNEDNAYVLFIRFLDYFSEGKNLKSFRISKACKNFIFSGLNGSEIEFDKEDSKLSNQFNQFIKNEEGVNLPFWDKNEEETFWEGFRSENEPDRNKKRFISTYTSKINGKEKRYTELIYQTGYILPEEFMQIMLETILQYGSDNKPVRIVLDEIGRIGSSMPLLYKSKTAGELFLTAVNHIIRNYNIRLLITGTTGEYAKSDEIINKTKTLVDDVLTTKKINVFGDNYVTIKGGTLTSSEYGVNNIHSDENVPGVIIPIEKYTFKVDRDKFIGLVGFDTDKIYRPGIKVYLYNENPIQIKYNHEINDLLNFSFGTYMDDKKNKNNSSSFEVKGYDRTRSTAFHDSLGFNNGNPIQKTVIGAIDEFTISNSAEDFNKSLVPIDLKNPIIKELFPEGSLSDGPVHSLPYYDNVLLLAINTTYLNGIGEDYKDWTFSNWIDIESKVKELVPFYEKYDEIIDFVPQSDETLTCIFLDALLTGNRELKINYLNRIESNVNFSDNDTLNNLNALRSLISTKRSHSHQKNISHAKYSSGDELILNPNSLFYFSWYSELRNLIQSNPHLADKIWIYALPGGGFKGDWHLGIIKGSVSTNLGLKILSLLCSELEDYKRFVRGVGLPTSVRFYKNNVDVNRAAGFLAWPGSKYEPQFGEKQLFKIFEIHDNANKRSQIEKYKELRQSFNTMYHLLEKIEGNYLEEIKKIITDRLPKIIERMTLKNTK